MIPVINGQLPKLIVARGEIDPNCVGMLPVRYGELKNVRVVK